MRTMKTKNTNTDLKIFAGIGAVAIVTFIFGIPFLIGLKVLSSLNLQTTGDRQQTIEQATGTNLGSYKLGEEGSPCGGEFSLPCRPGLECSSDPKVPNSEGVCKTGTGQ